MSKALIEFHGMFLQPSETAQVLLQQSWEKTPLGPPEHWPETLKAMVQQCLNAGFPMTIGWGPDLLILYNDAHLPIMGAKHPAAMGQPALEVYPEITDFLAPALRRTLQDGETVLVENQCLAMHRGKASDPLREGYFSISYTPIHDSQGQRCGVLSIATETTDAVLQTRRRATTARLAELLINHPAQSSNIPDIRSALLANNQDFHRIIFYQTHDQGRSVVPIWGHPRGFHSQVRNSRELERALDHLRTLGQRGQDVFRVGERMFASVVASHELLGNRAMIMLVEPATDVAANQQYEEFLNIVHEVVVGGFLRILSEQSAYAAVKQQLDERDRLYRTLFEHSSEAIVLLEPQGPVIAANPATCDMLGYTEAEIMELGYLRIAFSETQEIGHALTQLASHGRAELTARLRRKDSTTLLADVSAVQFHDPHARADRIIVLLRDAQPRLLSQQQLTTSARMQALGELTGGISHDFNNLLNVIISGTEEVLEQLPADDPERATAELVLQGGMQAADLTRQLLAFSQRRPMQTRSISAGEALQDLVSLLERTLGGGIQLSFSSTARSALTTDPSQLKNALLNLCLNARDAMPGGGRLTLETSDRSVDADLADTRAIEPGCYVEFLVVDEGEGIPPTLIDRVVEPFVTGRPDHQGLGLSMVYGYVRQSGGSMRIESTPGEGTRVQLLLPASSAAPGSIPSSKPTASERAAGSGCHLVMAEDNDMLGPMLKRTLEQAGYRVSLCTDATTALQLIQQDNSVEVLVTDIVLGDDMDGWTLIEQARQQRPELHIVSMSGYAAGQFQQQAAHRHLPSLSKPFRPRELVQLLKRIRAAD